jgi:hypothetical protein
MKATSTPPPPFCDCQLLEPMLALRTTLQSSQPRLGMAALRCYPKVFDSSPTVTPRRRGSTLMSRTCDHTWQVCLESVTLASWG